MSKVSQPILTAAAIGAAVAMGASTLAIDMYNAASVPVWYWLLLVIVAATVMVLAVERELHKKPSRSEVITNVGVAALFLISTVVAPAGSVLKVMGTTVVFMHLIMGGFRYVRLIMIGVKR